MYSDTHFHFEHLIQRLKESSTANKSSSLDAPLPQFSGQDLLSKMADNDCRFALDIGTASNDLQQRQMCVDSALSHITKSATAQKVRNFMYFSAGVWPSVDELEDVPSSIKRLKGQIEQTSNSTDADTLHRKIIAVGECGMDHHYNPNNPDHRNKEDFTERMLQNEYNLFFLQLQLATRLSLPIIVHSREAFLDTLNCIKDSKHNFGIIHCFSYGIDEARAFLDLGYHISLSGAITYTKPRLKATTEDLVRFIPRDRLLCETDSPYLAPVPHRGKVNTPLYVCYVYEYIAKILGITVEDLCKTVDNNIATLFNLAI